MVRLGGGTERDTWVGGGEFRGWMLAGELLDRQTGDNIRGLLPYGKIEIGIVFNEGGFSNFSSWNHIRIWATDPLFPSHCDGCFYWHGEIPQSHPGHTFWTVCVQLIWYSNFSLFGRHIHGNNFGMAIYILMVYCSLFASDERWQSFCVYCWGNCTQRSIDLWGERRSRNWWISVRDLKGLFISNGISREGLWGFVKAASCPG